MRPSRALLQAAMDKIHMRGMTFTGFHGVLDAERALGQNSSWTSPCSTDTREAGASDDIAHTVDYARAYDLVKRRVESDPANLIEKVSADIARTLLEEFHRRGRAGGVRKPHVAVSGWWTRWGWRFTENEASGSDVGGGARVETREDAERRTSGFGVQGLVYIHLR